MFTCFSLLQSSFLLVLDLSRFKLWELFKLVSEHLARRHQWSLWFSYFWARDMSVLSWIHQDNCPTNQPFSKDPWFLTVNIRCFCSLFCIYYFWIINTNSLHFLDPHFLFM
jgi:hypothetical protein